jgi:4-amino-4-deoxy-L-arabinose transferase-like glycosyltransferase
VALLHVGIALAALMITSPRFRPTAAAGARRLIIAHLIGFGLLLLITLPWPMAVMRALPHALETWRYESVGEFADNARNARPWWYYGPMLAQLALPWIAFAVVGVMLTASRGRRDARHRRGWFPLLWIAATVLVFSFVHMKKAAYLLPLMPAIVLLAAEGVAAVTAYLRRPAKSREVALVILRASGAIVIACGALAIAVVALRYAIGHRGVTWVTLGRMSVAVTAVAAGGVVCSRPSMAHRRWFEIQAAGAAVLMVLMQLISGAYNPAPREPFSESGAGAVEAAVIVNGDAGV